MQYNIFIVDAFTSKQFSGNPAAVVPLETWLPEELMQSVATENNLSETAFFIKNKHKIFDTRNSSPFFQKSIDFTQKYI